MKPYQRAAVGLVGLILSQSNVGAAVVSLGSASSYAVLGHSTVTNTGSSVITGDLGLSPGTSITGFPPGVVTGSIHTNDPSASSAQADALQAYNDLGMLVVTSDLTGQDLARTLSSGIYNFDSSAALSGRLVLDGAGDYVFLIGSTLITSSASEVSLINGASAANVFFRVGSSATLGTSSMFAGTIIAHSSITATTGADIEGRLIALNGAVTLDSNNVMVVPEPSSALSLLIGMGLLLKRRRE
jgi:hypothetical protein